MNWFSTRFGSYSKLTIDVTIVRKTKSSSARCRQMSHISTGTFREVEYIHYANPVQTSDEMKYPKKEC